MTDSTKLFQFTPSEQQLILEHISHYPDDYTICQLFENDHLLMLIERKIPNYLYEIDFSFTKRKYK